jgi:hypothetical protein
MGALRARVVAPALFLLILAIVIPLTADSAHAQEQFESFFTMDLDEVSQLYQARYRDRLTDAVIDSLVAYDWETIPIGNQRARVPTFMKTDYSPTRVVVDYRLVPGYRTTIRVPRTAFFERDNEEVGELLLPTPRDVDNPDLFITLTADSNVAKDVMVQSRRDLWRDYHRASVAAIPLVQTDQASGGIRFEIPVPMPKTLESIFGPGDKTSITIRGREEITIAGETRVVNPYIGIEGRESQSLFPSLDMEQKLDVSLTGTIGDKVSIQVDHSSEATLGSDANRVRLAYTGYEDEVIQLIELGNTNLSLPGSQLVSVSTNAQGLFGIKMLAKLGSTDITMIASKQEGEAAAASFTPTGGSLGQTETRTIRDVDYIKNKYFYVDDPASFVGASEVAFEVYREVTPQDLVLNPTINRVPGWAIPDSVGNGQSVLDAAAAIAGGGRPVAGRATDFKLLERGIDYEFVVAVGAVETIVGIELFEPIPNTAQKTLAIRYTNLNDQPVGGSYSDYGITAPVDTLMLEMIKAPVVNEIELLGSGKWRAPAPEAIDVIIAARLASRLADGRFERSSWTSYAHPPFTNRDQ